jgi:ferredoxin
MHVTVDQDRCCSAGQCVLTAPTVFDQNDDEGLVELLQADPAEPLHHQVRLAATLCPAGAITIREDAA